MSLSNGTLYRQSLPVNQLLDQAIAALELEWISECRTLCQILANPHIRALLNVADAVARQAYDRAQLEHILQVLASESRAKAKSTKTALLPRKRRQTKQKVVNVVKAEEPLGVTVRFDEKTGDIILARVLVGGAAYRSGLLAVNDRILEVNGISLRGRSHLDVISTLQRECLKPFISFRIVVCRQMADTDELTKSMYIVRAHFDFDPSKDTTIPCDKIGLSFSRGSILNVLNRDDPEWWQAAMEHEQSGRKTRMEVFQIAGLIPSKCLQERRTVAIRELKSHLDRYRYIHILAGLLPTPFRKAKWSVQKVKKVMYHLADCGDFDREEIPTYELVAKYLPPAHYFRPVILVGPPGVGCNTLIRLLVNSKPNRYREPLMHTTRYRRFAENDGIDYFFVREEWMEREIHRGNFVCYHKFRGNYYGLHKATLRSIIDSGYVALFKMDPQFLRLIHTAEFKPYVIFIRPPYDVAKLIASRAQYIGYNSNNNRKSNSRLEYEMHLMIYEAHKMHYLYGHKFDSVLVNEDLAQTYHLLYDILVSVENEPKWVPLTWVNKP